MNKIDSNYLIKKLVSVNKPIITLHIDLKTMGVHYV